MRIGIIYDQIDDYAHIEGPADRFAEFEPASTISAMKTACEKAGLTPVDVGSPHHLLRPPQLDLAWNIAEGYGTRNREAWAPVLLEMHGIPYLGSDAAALSTSLDKYLSRLIARDIGIPVAEGTSFSTPGEVASVEISRFPVMLKPRYEGTSKGIGRQAVVHDRAELESGVADMITTYQQDVLAEELLPGAEYTCSVCGSPLRALPVMQRSIDRDTRLGVHALSGNAEVAESDQILPGTLDPELEARLNEWSLKLCHAMKVRHFARIDFKTDAEGTPRFLEINPLPTFAIDSMFGVLAEIEGTEYTDFLADLLLEITAEY